MEVCLKTGFRSEGPTDVINDDLVQQYDESSERYTRSEVRNQLKWTRIAINKRFNLPSSAWALLDELIGLSHDVDWSNGPITVWPSNELMMMWLDCSERTVQSLLAQLRQANLVCCIDSPSRHRWGRRDETTGRIIEAYGIDLRPLAYRFPELLSLAEKARAERSETINKRRIALPLVARLSERVRTAIDTDGPKPVWVGFAERIDEIQTRLASKRVPLLILNPAIDALRELDVEIRKAFVKLYRREIDDQTSVMASSQKNESGEGAENCTLETTPNPQSSIEDTVRLSDEAVDVSTDQSDQGNLANDQTQGVEAGAAMNHLATYKVSIDMIRNACPRFCDIGFDVVGRESEWTWSDLKNIALTNLGILGVGRHAYDRLLRQIGPIPATVAVAIVVERFCRGSQGNGPVVANPGGYLLWIAKAAKDSNLIDLGPKLHALIDKWKDI